MKSTLISWRSRYSVELNAKMHLPALAQEFFHTGRQVVSQEATAEALHQFRLRAKRFRYTLEFFLPFYGPSMARRLASLRHVQDLLGDMSDGSTTRALISDPRYGKHPQVKRFLDFLSQRTSDRIEEFRRYWQQEFDREGEAARWIAYLARYTKRRTPRRPGRRLVRRAAGLGPAA